MLYYQKIFDTTAGWCFYTLDLLTATPLTTQTTPNHTNNLVPTSYALISSIATRDHQDARFLVGNALAGDTLDVCDFLDPGDGTGIAAALVAAGASTQKKTCMCVLVLTRYLVS